MARRALHGVNLTGWLSLESWVTPEMFAGSGTLSERGLMRTLGRELYHDLVSEHRQTFIDEKDFKLIARRGFNAIRLPVPWYVFGTKGPEPGPYLGCVEHVDHAIEWAGNNDLQVLLVLSVSPGSQDEDDPLGDTGLERRQEMFNVLGALSRRYASASEFFGIEVASEPVAQPANPSPSEGKACLASPRECRFTRCETTIARPTRSFAPPLANGLSSCFRMRACQVPGAASWHRGAIATRGSTVTCIILTSGSMPQVQRGRRPWWTVRERRSRVRRRVGCP